MSRLLFSAIVKTLTVAGVGTGALIGYKTYRKSEKHPQLLSYHTFDEAKFDKTTMQFNLKSREEHLNEAMNNEYDLLVIG